MASGDCPTPPGLYETASCLRDCAVQVRAQRLVGEVLLPQPGRELGHARGRVLSDALQHVHQIGVRIDAVQPASGDQALHDASVLGADLAPAEQPRLFERFYRGAAGRASGAPGTGLGLAIAREIIERHEGWLELTSEGISGKGAAFTILLPA